MLLAKLARVLLALPFALSVNAHATVVTFDFDDLVGRVVHANYYQEGFRFSPNCHYDGGFRLGDNNWLGWDAAGCYPNSPDAPNGALSSNPDWLGPPELSPNSDTWTGGQFPVGLMYINFTGGTYSLFETDVNGKSLRFRSSNGGDFTNPDYGINNYKFSGPEWRNIDWLLITSSGAGQPFGIDNLVLQYNVPEPATLALVGAALLGVAATRRRRLTLPIG